MNKTRNSLWYPVGYSLGGGISFMLLPALSANLFMSNTVYPDLVLRVIGVFLFALGIIMLQIVRLRVETLYPTTLIVRAFVSTAMMVFYIVSMNPLFLVLFGIVTLGMVMTGYSYLSERRPVAA